jgi:hypothetical protein
LLGLLWLSISGLRYVVWGLFALAGTTALWLSEWGSRRLDRPTQAGAPALNAGIGALVLALSLTALPGLRPAGNFPEVYTATDTPAAAAWLADRPAAVRGFTT